MPHLDVIFLQYTLFYVYMWHVYSVQNNIKVMQLLCHTLGVKINKRSTDVIISTLYKREIPLKRF